MNTQTLRERFEKDYCPDPEMFPLFMGINSDGEYEQALTRFAFIQWSRGYQSSTEDNQCVVELPKIIEVKDQKYPYDTPCLYYSANEVIAAIEASGAVIKEKVCTSCDGSGDLHRADGEYLGYCGCSIGQRLKHGG